MEPSGDPWRYTRWARSVRLVPGTRSWTTGGGQHVTRKLSVAALRLVLLELATFADIDSGIWPSVGQMAVETDLNERTVRAALRALERQRVIQTKIGNGRDDSAYTLLVSPIEAAFPAVLGER